MANLSFSSTILLDATTPIWQARVVGKQNSVMLPAYVALEPETKKIAAFGTEAYELELRSQPGIEVVQPVSSGSITNIGAASALLSLILDQLELPSFFLSMTLVIALPVVVSPAGRELWQQVALRLRFTKIIFVTSVIAEALGSGVPLNDVRGSCVYRMTPQLFEAGVSVRSSLVTATHDFFAIEALALRLCSVVYKTQRVVISPNQVEQMLFELGFSQEKRVRHFSVLGKDALSHQPLELEVATQPIYEAIDESFQHYSSLLRTLFANVPPELSADIFDRGVLLSGELSLATGLTLRLVAELGVAVTLVEKPTEGILDGLAVVAEHPEYFT